MIPQPEVIWVAEGTPEYDMTWEELVKQIPDVIYIVRRQVEREAGKGEKHE